MTHFQPFPGMVLDIGMTSVEFVPHPLFPGDKDAVFVLEGGEGLIYKVCDRTAWKADAQVWHALKVFKPLSRGEHILRVSDFLASNRSQPGLLLGRRVCITRTACPELVKRFPELEFAVLMPWLPAQTWAGFFQDEEASASYTLAKAYKLALATANVLWNLESGGLAHGDLAGTNILFSSCGDEIQLLDLEGMYIPGLPEPGMVSYGSPGYQHRCLGPTGQWCPEGDRFAGAILLIEMLTWWHPRVRAQVDDFSETLFRPEELQLTGSLSWATVCATLQSMSSELLDLFNQAWNSSTLADCPDFATWTMALLAVST